MGNHVQPPGALALDFDGVLCNGLKEYFQAALNAYRRIWSAVDIVQADTWEPMFERLRPVVETGWEMPLVLKAIQEDYAEADILLDWPRIRDQILLRSQLEPKQIGIQVDTLRDQWIAEDLPSWLALHKFYPGVSDQLRHWAGQDFPLFIVTTKESRFVQALLHQNEIELPAADIFGKDRQQPKHLTLRELQAQGLNNIWFVEDRLATLTGIRQHTDLESVALFLGDWGYNTEGEHRSIHLLSLARFTQPFEQWLG
jgi:phosphoglycolate phosphatase-like HAD superfamily hydrolase